MASDIFEKRPFSGPIPEESRSDSSISEEELLPEPISEKENSGQILKLFPADTKVLDYKASSEKEYTASLRLKCHTKEDFKSWLAEFERLSGNNYRVAKTIPRTGKIVIYKATYRCQHNTYPNSHVRVKAPSKKHTGCRAIIKVSVKSSVEGRKVRSKDVLRADYPTVVDIFHHHNHNIGIAEAVKYKDPTDEVRKKFIELFSSRHPPAQALEIHKRDLLEEHEENFYQVIADRSLCPDVQWVYRLYYSVFKKQFGEIKKGDFLKSLETFVNSSKTVKTKIEIIDGDFIIALCSPLMQRIHSLERASQTVFIDSSGNMDRYNCRVFLLMTDSPVGGLPLGVLVSSCEMEKVITAGLKLLQDILPENAFGGANEKGPASFLTDDSVAQQNSLKAVFPESNIWLCSFHVLQAVWRWLWSSQHNIEQGDRRSLYMLFKKILTSEEKSTLRKNIAEFQNNETVLKYPNFKNYIDKYLLRLENWAICFRRDNKGNNTNNIVEAAMRVLKDKILHRSRAYNVQQLFYFLSETLPEYYSQKILDVISGRTYNINKYFPSQKKLEDLIIIRELGDIFVVQNTTMHTEYEVNASLGFCTCPVGNSGAPCKHQHFVSIKKEVFCPNIIPIDESQKIEYHYIAVGNRNVAPNWYSPLLIKQNATKANTSNYNDKGVDEIVCEPDIKLDLQTDDPENELDWDDYEEKWSKVTTILKENFLKNPSDMAHAMDSMISQFVSIKTQSGLISAMHQFGKTGFNAIKAGRNVANIPVQPTAISRRKNTVGARKCQQTGRPPKHSYMPEHGYGKRKREINSSQNKSQKVPHCLQECVDKHSTLGK